MDIHNLPLVNVTLNAMSGVLIVLGYFFIRLGRKLAHQVCMISAVILSIAFLISYITHFVVVGPTKFHGSGWIRTIYLIVLGTHELCACALAFWLVPMTVIRAFRGRWEQHKKIAHYTFPIWLYVSVTGVLIYCTLRKWNLPLDY